jgi:hypothetical protein
MISDGKPILDACCGSRMFWFDKDNPLVDFQDIREEECVLSDGQICAVKPNFIGDFTDMKMPDKSYKLVIWDPPHLVWAGKNSNLYAMFGKLDDWRSDLKKGFDECMRVLDDYGVLILKWSDVQIKVKSIVKAIGRPPLVGHKTSRHCIWMVWMKMP